MAAVSSPSTSHLQSFTRPGNLALGQGLRWPEQDDKGMSEMWVTSYGFSIDSENQHASLEELFRSMRQNNGVPDTTKANERRFYIDDQRDANFVRGLVVTVKDQRKFLELVDEQGNFTIKVNNLRGTNKLMEFNFFVINKANGLGLYQYYHHSCSPGTFGAYLKTRFRALSDASRDAQIAGLHARGEHSRKAETRIRSEHKMGLNFSLLTRNEDLAEILTAFKEIRGFEYELLALDPVVHVAQPLRGLVRRVKERVAFEPNLDKNAVAAGIQAMLGQIRSKTARVAVVDDDDVPLSVRVANIPENFGEKDFDEIAGEVDDLDVAVFSGHAIIASLLDICTNEYEHVFMAAIED